MDLRFTADYLEVYRNKFGYFPNASNWDDLESVLRTAGVMDKLLRGPFGENYTYYYCSDTGSLNQNAINHFVLQAILEELPKQAPILWDSAVTSTPTGWICNTVPQCNVNIRQYCLTQ